LKAILEEHGVKLGGDVKLGGGEQGGPVIARHESEPLSALLYALGKNSDNFYAEMLLKVVAAHALHRPGSSQGGAERAQKLLEQAGVARGSATILNGSGLFRGGNIAPDHLVKVLLHMYRSPDTRPEYLSHLAIAGVDGTLRSRLADLPKARIVRAKTGTLDDVIALSGYVLGPTPDRALAFSFLFNGVSGKQWQARALADDLVRALVSYLYQAHASK
jgi:D-alanyl-D-alanine carboxypeptidase/D-alanyl-D-alanine-endopeptidase (penicillin-binding protein 4)